MMPRFIRGTRTSGARLAGVLLAAMACCAISFGAGGGTRQAAAKAAPKIEDLAWMAGDWQTAPGRTQIEEHWTLPAGGTMIGMGRTLAGGRTVFYEYLRLEQRADGIYYVAHPKARTPGTEFKLTRLQGREATFENPAHDFPKKITYARNADGSLSARVEGDGSEKEKPQEFHFQPMRGN